jgi:hypothetical protein
MAGVDTDDGVDARLTLRDGRILAYHEPAPGEHA